MFDFGIIDPLAIGLNIKKILSFPLPLEEGTGEVLKLKRSTTYRGLTFTIVPTKKGLIVKVRGSIHEFANNGLHNYDRFTLSRFIQAVEELRLLISPEDRIRHIEFGINIHTPFDPKLFIRELVAHQHKQFNREHKGGTLCAEVTHAQYKIKIYDKGHQSGQGNILRYELKYFKMENILPNMKNKYPDGIKWGDLTNPEVWVMLGDKLKETFAEIVYYDPTLDYSAISSVRDREILNSGKHSRYWEELKGPNVSRTRKRYLSALRKHGTLFVMMPELIEEEIAKLIDIGQQGKVINSDRNLNQIITILTRE